uniref:Uncharacterized protein LOC111114318 n=1 Tax=Crassostrea virginica TaxID=6565 RepID=A0A8B8BYD1_CRAVI|nr:uncharacterized protein LOC111114318 [Crassostrea virginica]
MKEQFYETLQNIMSKRTEREVVLLIGDFNAKVGNDNTGYRATMGQHGVGTMNENGQQLADFCANNNLVIGGTVFPHKEIHKTTWVSPDKVTHNQIDHICINTKFRRSLLDVRARRGVDAATDHRLVVGKVQLKLRKHNNIRCKKAFITTLEESVGRKKNNQWIKQSTLNAMDERKILKEKLLNARTRSETFRIGNEYKEKHKKVRQQVKEDEKQYIEELTKEAENAAEQRNMKEQFKIIRELSGKKTAQEKPVRDKNGIIQTAADEQKQRWKKHFEELLNRPSPESEADIPPADEDYNISLDPPTKEEVKRAINMLNNGKSGGPDSIPAEAMTSALDTLVNMVHPLLKQIWEEENIPQALSSSFQRKEISAYARTIEASCCSQHQEKSSIVSC